MASLVTRKGKRMVPVRKWSNSQIKEGQDFLVKVLEGVGDEDYERCADMGDRGICLALQRVLTRAEEATLGDIPKAEDSAGVVNHLYWETRAGVTRVQGWDVDAGGCPRIDEDSGG